MMTWAKGRRLTDWATQASSFTAYFKTSVLYKDMSISMPSESKSSHLFLYMGQNGLYKSGFCYLN